MQLVLRVSAVKRHPVLHHSAKYIFISFRGIDIILILMSAPHDLAQSLR